MVLSPEGTVELDYGRKLPGRGAWLYPNRSCFDRAEEGRGFGRSFKNGKFRYESDRLWNNLIRTNKERLKSDIRLAKKASGVISGGNNVEVAMRHGQVRLLLLADDAADNTVRKFTNVAFAGSLPVVRALTCEELGHVLGKAPRAVVGVTHPAFEGRLKRNGAIYDAVMNRSKCQRKR